MLRQSYAKQLNICQSERVYIFIFSDNINYVGFFPSLCRDQTSFYHFYFIFSLIKYYYNLKSYKYAYTSTYDDKHIVFITVPQNNIILSVDPSGGYNLYNIFTDRVSDSETMGRYDKRQWTLTFQRTISKSLASERIAMITTRRRPNGTNGNRQWRRGHGSNDIDTVPPPSGGEGGRQQFAKRNRTDPASL